MFRLRSPPSASSSRTRREQVRRDAAGAWVELRDTLQRPEILYGAAFVLLLAVGGTLLAAWAWGAPVSVGMVALRDELNRVDYQVVNVAATEARRDEARKASPRIYRPNETYLSRIGAAIEGLPVATFEKSDLETIDPSLREEFGLGENSLARLQPFGGKEGPSSEWRLWTGRFLESLWAEEPLLPGGEYQLFATTLRKKAIPPAGGDPRPIRTAINLAAGDADTLQRALLRLAERAGFPGPVARLAVMPIVRDPRPTVLYDADRSEQGAAAAAAAVEPVMRQHPRNEVIVARGDRVTAEQMLLLQQSRAQAQRSAGSPVLRWVGFGGLLAALGAILVGWLIGVYPGVSRNPGRLLGLLVLTLGVAALAVVGAVELPRIGAGAAAICVVCAAIVARLCYDRGFGMVVAVAVAAIVAASLGRGVGFAIAAAVPGFVAIASLRELRHRACLMRAGGRAAFAAFVSFLLLGFLEVPSVAGAWPQRFEQSLLAAAGALAAGFLMLGILPSIERLFDVATGLTLSELRDPRHPLLRMLQQRAPGTYSHSLQIATIAEAAAEAIGADGLLVYVGALYHDIGKSNKPDYFIENQSPGFNRHEKLNPKLSLLVIVGHVKDGVALARAHGLPRVLHHFIESHHGTTLVEYFYRAAQSRAEALGDEQPRIAEFEFRYPGPKPRTPEAAILMLADASESASRAMQEPAAARLENLVRTLSRNRLEDGQFDDCSLTFRQLRTIEDSIIKSLIALHHGRISYQSTAAETDAPTPAAEPDATERTAAATPLRRSEAG